MLRFISKEAIFQNFSRHPSPSLRWAWLLSVALCAACDTGGVTERVVVLSTLAIFEDYPEAFKVGADWQPRPSTGTLLRLRTCISGGMRLATTDAAQSRPR